MNEEWKPIIGFEDTYEVSNLGRVRNSLTGFVLNPKTSMYGYLEVILHSPDRRGYKRVHRLVAESFLGTTTNLEVHHKDGNRRNNVISNLIICDSKEHRGGENCWKSRLSREDVEEIRKEISKGLSQYELAAKYYVAQQTISDIITGKTWKKE